MPCDEPGFVVARGELDERGAQLFDRIEGLHPKQVLLQGSYEAFGDAVALGFAYEGGRSFDAQAFDFILEIAGHVVGAVIVTQFQATRHAGRDGSEAPMHALAHRLQRLETIGRTRGVNADDFRIGVFHGDKVYRLIGRIKPLNLRRTPSRPSPHHRSSLQRSWPQSIAQGKMLAKLSLEATSERIPLLHKESWCVSVVDAARSGTANDPARIPAKGTAVVEAAGCCTKTAACTGDAARTETPSRRILGATGPGARGTVYAPVALPTPRR